jgi:hypothetical protein
VPLGIRLPSGARRIPWTSRRIARQIDRLRDHYLHTSQLYELEQDGVSLAGFVMRKRQASSILARTLARGEYVFAPALVRRVLIEDKERTVFSLRLTDLIVHGVITDVLQEAIAPGLSPRLYSYRKGRSWWTAISDFAAYMRTHRRERRDPRSRGVHVIRRDVKSYTDSIPVGDQAPIWTMLREALSARFDLEEQDWRLIVDTVRPEAYEEIGRLFVLSSGVPTGLPIACPLFNLYLRSLDAALQSIDGAFYARYSDDILFAHPSAAVTRAAAITIERALHDLGLSDSEEKRRDLYVTAAGRRSAEWPDARPAMEVPLLGCRIAADGTVSLSRRKARRLLREVQQRALRTLASCEATTLDEAGRIVCTVANRALMRRSDPFRVQTADLLRRVVTNRRQLHQIDYWIARIVLRVLTSERGARAFRAVPYRRMRRGWKLRSVLQVRNRWGRPAAP